MSAAQVPDPETIRNVARQIVNQPEYHEPWPWLEKLVAFGNMIKDWLNSLEAWATANPQIARVLAIAVVVLLLLLLIHLLYLAFGDLMPWKKNRSNPPARASRWEILQGVATNWRDAAALALRSLQEGDLRRAVWIAHRVMLGLLDERGAVKFAGWKTNSHYLRECAASDPWYATFAELTSVYEHAVYAQRPTVTTSVEHLVQRVDAMTKEIPREPAHDVR
jgi:hypothetical protein